MLLHDGRVIFDATYITCNLGTHKGETLQRSGTRVRSSSHRDCCWNTKYRSVKRRCMKILFLTYLCSHVIFWYVLQIKAVSTLPDLLFTSPNLLAADNSPREQEDITPVLKAPVCESRKVDDSGSCRYCFRIYNTPGYSFNGLVCLLPVRYKLGQRKSRSSMTHTHYLTQAFQVVFVVFPFLLCLRKPSNFKCQFTVVIHIYTP